MKDTRQKHQQRSKYRNAFSGSPFVSSHFLLLNISHRIVHAMSPAVKVYMQYGIGMYGREVGSTTFFLHRAPRIATAQPPSHGQKQKKEGKWHQTNEELNAHQFGKEESLFSFGIDLTQVIMRKRGFLRNSLPRNQAARGFVASNIAADSKDERAHGLLLVAISSVDFFSKIS